MLVSSFVDEVEKNMTPARKPFLRNLALWLVVPAVLASVLTAGMSVLTVDAAVAATHPCAAPVTSAVACENTLPGTPTSDWEVSGTGDPSLQGFATSMSVTAGSPVRFKIKSTASSYRIDILRLGYYQGNGARKVAVGLLPTASLPQTQPACLTFSATGLIDCGNWAQSALWNVPADAVSGVYIAHLIRNDTGGSSLIPFVVRDDASRSSIVFQTSDTTWQAYNSYGGNSLYRCTVACPPGNPQTYKAAFAVSYNRPFNPTAQGPNWLMDAEMPMIKFMEANGYDVTYQAGVDTSTRGSLLLNHKVFMSVGHDEYWDASQRANVEAARDAGVNLAFFSGNEIFWKTRWESSSDGSSTPGRTMVSYKDTHFNAPTDPVEWTGTWRDPRYGTSGGGGNPENALTGQFFLVNAGSADIKVPAEYAPMRLWRNTAAAALTGNQSLTLGAGLSTLGYEWDADSDNGFRPAGSFRLSSTTVAAPEVFTDYGSTIAPATVTHNLTIYRAPSGALVFGAGTIQWSYGLDSYPSRGAPDRNMQQATVNLFADMGAQPATLMAGLVAATKSTDTTAPTSVITSGLGGQTLADGAKITIAGTASDSGGVVAGIEVSTDAGASWRPATGKSNWTFTWIAHGSPASNVKTRAVDDSGNLETPGAGATVNITCPCSIFGTNVIPDVADSGDAGSVELGLRFTSDTPGTVTGVRFYKSANNLGTHSGSLWSSAGQRLATANFSNETATGWQAVTFSTPVTIAANTSYVVSYFAPQGRYAQSSGYMYPPPSPMPAGNGSLDSAPLRAPRSTPAQGNGLYNYSSASSFPSNSFNGENYWVDVIYSPATATVPSVTSTTPAAGATGVAVGAAPSATFDQTVTPASITFTLTDAAGATVAGTTGYGSTTSTATFTPTAALAKSTTYTASVTGATNSAGQTMTTPKTWTFTTAAPPTVPTVTSTSPAASEVGVAVSAPVRATFDQAVTSSSITFTLKDAAGVAVTGSTTFSTTTNTM
ncbi:N,N-dimethylformamidase beta subunit family domain-containing protein, partial [Cryobacterium psychrophilum]|uniref:N,N-dimethylformamidase beta subunit family domain-containing protein n=1 Tax=Cryobacterium psychrophilum TaxID=41988 RepID=UPI001F547B5C